MTIYAHAMLTGYETNDAHNLDQLTVYLQHTSLYYFLHVCLHVKGRGAPLHPPSGGCTTTPLLSIVIMVVIMVRIAAGKVPSRSTQKSRPVNVALSLLVYAPQFTYSVHVHCVTTKTG